MKGGDILEKRYADLPEGILGIGDGQVMVINDDWRKNNGGSCSGLFEKMQNQESQRKNNGELRYQSYDLSEFLQRGFE